MLFNNYRPVSILPILSKILERIMYNRLLEYLEELQILSIFQFGFRKNHSAAMALTCLVDKISKALENGEYVLGIFLDFSKAFDTVDTDILLSKLYHYGIRDCMLDWFKSYLTDRDQYVSYNGYTSGYKRVKCGVPQGSILGPLLFLIYVNDIASVSDSLLGIMFADDTNMFLSGTDMYKLQQTLNVELEKINLWIQVNKLSLNINKTHFMLFKGRKLIPFCPEIKMNGQVIQRIDRTKFLGVILDDRLSWVHHIDYIAKKVSKSIGILYRLRRYLDTDTLINMYYAFVYPYFHYCNEIWGNAYATHLKRLKVLQKRAIRIISMKSQYVHTTPLFKKFNILRLSDINTYLIGQFMHRAHYSSLPTALCDMFVRNVDVYSYSTRQRHDFHLPKPRTNLSKMCMRYKGALTWNSLCKVIDYVCPLVIFKGRLKSHILESIS